METYDSGKLNKEPFVINNQVYILGNPAINAFTLEQLVYAMDQVGSGVPIVIVNPQAQTVPDFENKLSQLIQNNRRIQTENVTTLDKYRFKDMSDDELNQLVQGACQKNPALKPDSLLNIYQGLRARAQALYALEMLLKERDSLWAAHCANPSSTEGSERYSQLQYSLIPQAQSNYENIARQLQSLQVEVSEPSTPVIPESSIAAQQSSVIECTNSTQVESCNTAAVQAAPPEVVDNGLKSIETSQVPHPIWGPWLKAENLCMPLKVAADLVASPGYVGLIQQQRDVEFEGTAWKAVEPKYLLALGIKLYPDGLPICYTQYGTFKRVGKSNVPLNNLDYWYPKPKKEI